MLDLLARIERTDYERSGAGKPAFYTLSQSMSGVNSQTRRILERCSELGFALAGVCDAAPTEYEGELLEWLARGKHGEMSYLGRNVELRIDARRFIDGRARSIICVADRHEGETSKRQNGETARQVGEGTAAEDGGVMQSAIGRIARYARGEDYHVVMKKRLSKLCRELEAMFPDEVFRACVDTAPILEREHAQRAGIGAVGKNTLLLQRGVGSYLLLGEIVTTLALDASPSAEPDPCSTCRRCIDACPTQAIAEEGWSVDATRCISYLTIEHRGEIDERYHQAMGDWIFGCDVCQEVCPHNAPGKGVSKLTRAEAREANPAYEARREGFDLLEVLNWDEEARRAAFIKSSMKRARLDMMKRNALIAAGNVLRKQSDEPLKRRIEQIGRDDNEALLVQTTARAVLRDIDGNARGRDRCYSG